MTLREILKRAKREKWAIGQFNFSTLEQLRGIAFAAKKNLSPVILGLSQSEADFFGLEEAISLVKALEKKLKFKFFLNLDHGKDLNLIRKAVDLGFEAVHFDGSSLSFKKNLELTREVVKYAKKKKVLVEGELGYLRGESRFFSKKKVKIKKEDLTKPEEVEEFVEKTKIDSLAIAIGNVHGIYPTMPKLDFERLKEIREKTDAFLVLHGGSGFPSSQLEKAINFGVQKININTELRVVWRKSLEKQLKKTKKEVKPYLILPKVISEIQKEVEKYIFVFKSRKKLC